MFNGSLRTCPSISAKVASIMGAIFGNESTTATKDVSWDDRSDRMQTTWESPKWEPTKTYWDSRTVNEVAGEVWNKLVTKAPEGIRYCLLFPVSAIQFAYGLNSKLTR